MATVQPSKNRMLNMAWTAFKKEQRAEKKAPKEEATVPVAKTPASKQVVRKKPAKARRK